jgi:hypothetical protein
MSENGLPPGSEPRASREPEATIPSGYRCAVVTAITVVLGFSFLFLRSWAFELPGEWTASSELAAFLLLCAILLELWALWRALQPKDERVQQYERTLRCFLASLIVLLVSLVLAAVSYSHNV